MNTFLAILFSVMGVMYILAGWSIYNMYKKLKKKYKTAWPAKHRLDANGNLQYSVDGKIWTNILGYSEDFDYGKYKGPALEYIHIDNTGAFNVWKNNLSTIERCHEWNRKALDTYIREVKEYLKDK